MQFIPLIVFYANSKNIKEYDKMLNISVSALKNWEENMKF